MVAGSSPAGPTKSFRIVINRFPFWKQRVSPIKTDFSGHYTIVDAQGVTIKGDSAVQDKVYGNQGADKIYLQRGNDVAFGGDGNDQIYGIAGNNELRGNIGNDVIYSGRDTSTLFGGGGDDALYAQLADGADHTLEGGAGTDKFIMQSASSTNTSNVTINDFTVGVDSLTIGETLINGSSGPSGVTASENADGDTVVNFSDDETVTLKGVSFVEFSGADSPTPTASAGQEMMDIL